jgi:hypothetical protein
MKHSGRPLFTLATALLAAGALAGCGDDDDNPVQPITPGAGTVTGTIAANRTFFAETTYMLSGFVKVPQGVTLTIRPGTKIVGDVNTPSALFILRGGKIDAQGTAQNPIVFTSGRAEGSRRPGDWGGLIIVGAARINRAGAVILEGTSTRPADAVNYGEGTNDADDSGVLRYVRIEYAGFAEAQNQELNALTLAAVGSGTEIDHVQTVAGLDDSFEWFGGTVDAKYLVSYESGDDHFDAAEGYRGRNQFLIALQTQRLTPAQGSVGVISNDPQGFEVDGCDPGATGCAAGANSEPLNMPVFANFTVVGTGAGVVDATNGGYGMFLRRGTGGTWVNGIVARWPKAGLTVRDQATVDRIGVDSLTLQNILFVENALTIDNAAANLVTAANFATAAFDSTSSATTAASLFTGFPTAALGPNTPAINWTPAAASPAASGGLAAFTGVLAARTTGFAQGTTYRGAVAAGDQWYAGWTTSTVDVP